MALTFEVLSAYCRNWNVYSLLHLINNDGYLKVAKRVQYRAGKSRWDSDDRPGRSRTEDISDLEISAIRRIGESPNFLK